MKGNKDSDRDGGLVNSTLDGCWIKAKF